MLGMLKGTAALIATFAALYASAQSSVPRGSKPNIILFLVDDMGWQETSVPFFDQITVLNRRYRTPNMERLAAQGVKFAQAYASAVCSPSRVSLLTGMNAARHRVTNWTLRKNQSPDNTSPLFDPPQWNLNGVSTGGSVERSTRATPLPALLREAGYQTIHVGKAHFGAKSTPGENPLNLGFAVNIAGHAAGGPGSYWGEKNFSAAWRTQPPDLIWDVPGLKAYHGKDIYLTEALTREAVKAVDKAVADNKPFYLYMSHYAVHAPWEKDDRFYQKYVDEGLKPFEATLASMIEGMDKSLGDILDEVGRLGVAENTIVLFMSDNGSPSQCPPNSPLRGHKLTPYEGGIREPMIVKWPGVVKPATTIRDPVLIEDFFPTILEMAGIDWRGRTVQEIDGASFIPLLRGSSIAADERAFVWHFPHTYGGQGPFSALRQGDLKLVYHHTERRLELFDIAKDIGETRDLSSERPDKVKALAQVLGRRLRVFGAQMPIDKATGKPIPWPDRLDENRKMIRIACIGDSITRGPGDDSGSSYPSQLSKLLGDSYEVRNFGVGSATLMARADLPYRRRSEFENAVDFDADVILVLLGVNDTCGPPRGNWALSRSFSADARDLLRTLKRPGNQVILGLPSPMFYQMSSLKPERRKDLEERAPRLMQVRKWLRGAARLEGVKVVDLDGTLAPDTTLVTDGVHPTATGYLRIAERFRSAIETKEKVPESSISRTLEWRGVAISDPDYSIWGASPIWAEGRYHLFAARWPEMNVEPAWRKSSEIAHYEADRPEGPFQFKSVVAKGTGKKGDWDACGPHNPEIRQFSQKYYLCYIANGDYHQPPHPLNQQIGMMVSDHIDGPWRKVGTNGLILGPSRDPNHFTYGKQVVNPSLLKVGEKYHLYFKTRSDDGTVYGLAVADSPIGPFRMLDKPITGKGVFIEDACAFSWDGKVCLLTTDNLGEVTGVRGGGVLWVSEDGINFRLDWTQRGFDLIPRYYGAYCAANVKKIYGSDPKFERPKVLCLDGRPAWFYAPSGWNVTGEQRTVSHVLKIELKSGDGPLSGLNSRSNHCADRPDLVRQLKDLLEEYKRNGRSTPGAPQTNDPASHGRNASMKVKVRA